MNVELYSILLTLFIKLGIREWWSFVTSYFPRYLLNIINTS